MKTNIFLPLEWNTSRKIKVNPLHFDGLTLPTNSIFRQQFAFFSNNYIFSTHKTISENYISTLVVYKNIFTLSGCW